MSLFYAYLKDSVYDHVYRYLITFVDRETADEWWRFISAPSSPYYEKIKRVSPQFYVQSAEKMNVTTFFSNASLPNAASYLQRMFFTLLNDRDGRILSIAPPIKIVDHISGKWYFVRSKTHPERFWYTRLSGKCLVCKEEDCDAVHVSTKYRTRFSIQVRNLSCKDFQAPKDFVIIGEDEISIAASKDYILRIDDAEELKATKVFQIAIPNLLFRFSDFKDRFVTRTEEQDNGEIWEYVIPVERGYGEVWELDV